LKTTELDLNFVREQFPAFSQPSLQDSAFFENAGGSYMCKQVMQRLESYYLNTKVQPYHPHPAAQLAGQQMDDAYVQFSHWLNVEPKEIFFGPSTSQNTYVLANAMLGWLQAGDEIIVTNQDHEANSGVWRNLASKGIQVKQWGVDSDTGSLDIDTLKSLLTNNTKLLVFPHCSNILGEINPVTDICQLAKDQGVRTLVDGVSYAGHGLPDIQAFDVDIYLFSLYKVYGTHQGVMVVKDSMQSLLENQGHFFNSDLREKRLTPAGPDHAQIAAATGVCDYFEAVYAHHFGENTAVSHLEKAECIHNLFIEAEQKLIKPLLDFFIQHEKIRIIGPQNARNRAPTISIIVTGHSSMQLAAALGGRSMMCGAGHFYSLRLLQAMGIDTDDGVLRFSLVHYSSAAEVTSLIQVLSELID
jgi:selenocysteine lyase/cysteine desulfurase